MNSKHMIAAFCAAGLALGALADETKPAPAAEESDELSWAPGEGVTFGETPVVNTEVGLAFDSRYMTYGVIDGKDPIVTPSAKMTFFDWAEPHHRVLQDPAAMMVFHFVRVFNSLILFISSYS